MAGGYRLSVRLRTFAHQALIGLVRHYYNAVWGTHISEGTRISLSAKIDRTYPNGVVIGKYSVIAFGASVLSHDFVNALHLQTKVGDYCFVGARAVIMPGVTVGDHCVVGTGSIVMRDVPSNSVAMGNPARVIEKGIMTGRYGSRVNDINGLPFAPREATAPTHSEGTEA